MARLLLALVLLAFPGPVDAAWQELKTTHFTLRTDLDPHTAIRTAVEIERTRAALLAAMWPPVETADIQPVDVIVLADGLEFERYAGRGSSGLYSHLALPPRIVLWGAPDRWEVRASGPRWLELIPLGLPGSRRGDSQVLRAEIAAHLEVVRAGASSVLRHELAHHVASAVYGRQPLWFSEGQAQFLESLALGEDGRSATIGRINPTAWLEFMGIRTTETADVLAWQTPGSQMPTGKTLGLFGTSWQLYQWLFTTRPAALHCYQERLAAAEDPARAWTQCFPDLVPGDVDRALWDFARLGTPATAQVRFRPVGLQVDVRPLSKAEVHLVRAQVALTAATAAQRPELLDEARVEVDRALAEDPACVGALRLQAPGVPPGVRLASGRMAVAAHPDDGFAWLLLADALWDTAGPADERDRAYRKAVELLPDSPLALGRAARNLLSRGERAAALLWAERGARLAPWNGEVLATYALSLAAVGRCEDGRTVARRAHTALSGSEGVVTTALEEGLKRACPTDAGIPPDER
jgi:tetratricopeptide (TPR) repeat protein